MQLTRLFLQGIACSALSIGSVCANPLTVYMTAHVTAVNDPDGILGGQVAVGQLASGLYRYETTPASPPPPPGLFPQGPGQGAVRVRIGSLLFQSDPQAAGVAVFVQEGSPPSGPGFFNIDSHNNQSAADGVPVQDILVNFQDPSGQAPSSPSLPADLPDLTRYTQSTISIGSWWGGYQVTLAIDDVSVFPPSTAGWSVSPGSGTYSRQQNIDAAVLLPAGSQVQSAQMLIGGMPVPLAFPGGYCSLQPPNSLGQPVILCPNAMPWLPNGVNQVEWQIQLMDGTMLDKGAVWELIP